MIMRTILITATLLVTGPVFSQNVFPEKFEGCVTDEFALESDTATAKYDGIEFVFQMKDWLGAKVLTRLRGTLKLQIIVSLDGSSCLLSVENLTNVKTKKMKLKEFVDTKAKWDPLPEKVAALVILEFTDLGVRYRRRGYGNVGWHYLK